ncbi:unnamed protein product [Clonostachys chloroleuca]|uniref:Saponin hydrolase n=1 Tax=Clonostachys chloroleuca TaxID=1926264 RepID=A0AA35PT63_9HYPO|nr:unnamed protein product [Clonostachys chloroleuca]
MHTLSTLFAFTVLVPGTLCAATSQPIPAPPSPEPIEVIELPLPPVSPTNDIGACSKEVNPNGTGCISKTTKPEEFQAGDFTPDGLNVIVNVIFAGAPAAPDPASIYSGEQVILIKADGTKFSNGDTWKCLSCGVPAENAQSLDPQRDYPHVFRSGDKALWGHNILDCGGEQLAGDGCTPENTHIYPIHWTVTADGSGPGGAPRELRLHPDDQHLGFSSFTDVGGQYAYLGRLNFNANPTTGEPRVPRYDIVNVNALVDLKSKGRLYSDGTELKIDNDAITVGELRGFSGTGDEVTYIGATVEANNIDVFATHLETGRTRRLSSHPEYVDPMTFSYDNKWMVLMDTRGSDRQMWMAGMRGIPPVIDVLTIAAASTTRNNGARRFFQPILLDGYGDRDPYYGQQVNAEGDGSNGSVNDPNWNGRADPAFSKDGTKIVFWQALVVAPACGGANPLPCPQSTAQGGREYRVMLAKLTSREPTTPPPAFEVPDVIPWAVQFQPGTELPSKSYLSPGEYTLAGKKSGSAHVSLLPDEAGQIDTVVVNYMDYSDDGTHIINGYENVTRSILGGDPWSNHLDWYSDLVQTGVTQGTKKTSDDGFHLTVNIIQSGMNATGELTTTINGKVYRQPANFT